MIPIILVTHGPLAPSMIESSEMLVGKSEKLSAITLQPSDNFEEFQEKIFTQAKSMDEGLLQALEALREGGLTAAGVIAAINGGCFPWRSDGCRFGR